MYVRTRWLVLWVVVLGVLGAVLGWWNDVPR